ncbi:uncharacterized protein B0H18DRAFT_1097494 [Fomitopsis serialis]|uniref:uncharacterized protein n=1 Tax=Fomitopsis serialis TaxID=139415 RepID=UPI002008C7C2|nr:uncharacterized protein B0H18DRAFT_1097494 [Neoantrodia serialis]KAH9913054.1 hypothetical protein B0H18DRAFT_1097494 [Neoantrodia serialis]
MTSTPVPETLPISTHVKATPASPTVAKSLVKGNTAISDSDWDGFLSRPRKPPGSFTTAEYYWRDRQRWLKECGYLLRPRYNPDWKPSWVGTDKDWYTCEDSLIPLGRGHVLDATRISDGELVVLKKISHEAHPTEAEIGQLLSSEPLASDPANNCVPILGVLSDPQDKDIQLIIMPMLRRCFSPQFQTVGEVLEFFRQALVGLRFMHRRNVAHRDATILNIMMDPTPMFPEMFHYASELYNRDRTGPAKCFARTERSPKYFWTDFGLSVKYDLDSETAPRLELPIMGGDKTAPEHQGELYHVPCDPIPTDVYYVGNLMREYFVQKYTNLEIMRPLVDDMVRDVPAERPTMDEVVERFEVTCKKLHWWNLRARLVRRSEWYIVRFVLGIGHVVRTVRYVVKGLPAVPVPPST